MPFHLSQRKKNPNTLSRSGNKYERNGGISDHSFGNEE
jgi:hypothetical protein